MTTATRDKVQEIVKVVKNTRAIDTKNLGQIVELQDLFNVNALQARQVVEQLGRDGRGRLLWIITTVAGQDTFEFWLKHGIAHAWAEKTAIRIEEEVAAAYRERSIELLDQEQELARREEEVARQALVRQNELDKREADLRHREGLAEIDIQRRVGNQVKMMREQLRQIQARLEEEQALNRKAKKLARLVEKI